MAIVSNIYRPHGQVRFAYGEDIKQIPEDVVEVKLFIGESGKFYVVPANKVDEAKAHELYENYTALGPSAYSDLGIDLLDNIFLDGNKESKIDF